MSERIDAKLWVWVRNVGMVVGWAVSIVVVVMTLKADIKTGAAEAKSDTKTAEARTDQIIKENIQRDLVVAKLADTVQIMLVANQTNAMQDVELRRLATVQAEVVVKLGIILVNQAEIKTMLQAHLDQSKGKP